MMESSVVVDAASTENGVASWRNGDFPVFTPPVWSWTDASPERERRNTHVADTLVLDARDEQSYFLDSLYSLLEHYEWAGSWNNNRIPLPIMMYQRYMETYPDKLEDLCYYSEEASFLGVKLVQACLLSENEQVQFLKYTCLSSKCKPKAWIEFLEAVPDSVFSKAVQGITQKIGDTTTCLFAELLNSATEREKKTTLNRLVEATIICEKKAMRLERVGDEVDGGDFEIDAATSVLKKTLMNPEISGKAIDPVVDVLLRYDPDTLRVDFRVKEKCGVELAEEKGPAFSAVAVKLFHQGCLTHQHNRQEMIKFLAQRKHIGDYTLKAIVAKEGHEVLTKDVIMACAGNGYTCTSCELSLQSSKVLSRSYEQTFLDILTHAQDVKVALTAFTQLTPDLYSMDCIDRDSNNALHIAGRNRFTQLIKQILDQGYSRLLWARNLKNQYPVQVCLEEKNYATAAIMLRAMNDWRLFVVTKKGERPIFSFQTLLAELTWAKCYKKLSAFNLECLPKHQYIDREYTEEEKREYAGSILPSGQRKQNIEDCIVAILDSTIDKNKGMFHYEVLEADMEGHTPDQDKDNPYGLTGYDPVGPNCIEIVAKQDLEVVAGHDSFRSLIKLKWKLYGWKMYLIDLLLYLLFLAILTAALTLAADQEDPSKYNTREDMFRLFCEIVVILGILIDVAVEVVDFWTNYDRRLRVYFSDWTNWLDMLAIITTLLIIPFRAMNSDVQWAFASLTYVFHSLRIFEYAIILRFFGMHVEVLVRVMVQDLSQFMLVFAVIMVTLGGGLFFALRGEPCPKPMEVGNMSMGFDKAINTSLCIYPAQTSTLYRNWFTGIRLLAEGETVVSPYVFKDGEDYGFNGLGALIYLIFLFTVIVILLNLLIAQFTTSYEEELSKARVSVTLNRAKALSRMWNPLWMKVILRFKDQLKHYVRFSYYKPTSPIMDLEDEDKATRQFEEISTNIQTSTKTVHKHLTDMQTTMTNRMHVELREQSQQLSNRESKSEVISELQQEIKQQATMIKQQAAMMEDLQAAMVKQTEMVIEQQKLMKQTWASVTEMKHSLQRHTFQS